MNRSTRRRLAATAVVMAVLAGATTACSSTAGGAGSLGSGKYVVWDPYPQFDDNSAWAKLLDTCGSQVGVTIARNSFGTGEMSNMFELAVQQNAAPDILIVDNPAVSTLARSGSLTTTSESGIDTSAVEPNLLAAGQSSGKTYGIPIGANTLALYYNKAILGAAGVDISSVTDWTTLTAALAKVSATGKMGITFSAVATEEGSFQFLPWFWGAGAGLTRLDSAHSVAALSLWTGWVKKGYASNSVLTSTQDASWKEFASGSVAFGENGTWQLAAAQRLGFSYGIIPVPAKDGGIAPAPLGGEFVTVPVQHSAARYATSDKLVTCLTSEANSYSTDSTLSYIAPTGVVQRKQVAADTRLTVWLRAVQAAKGRTGDNLGAAYSTISQRLSNAVHLSLGGETSPQAALAAAQSAAK